MEHTYIAGVSPPWCRHHLCGLFIRIFKAIPGLDIKSISITGTVPLMVLMILIGPVTDPTEDIVHIAVSHISQLCGGLTAPVAALAIN